MIMFEMKLAAGCETKSRNPGNCAERGLKVAQEYNKSRRKVALASRESRVGNSGNLRAPSGSRIGPRRVYDVCESADQLSNS